MITDHLRRVIDELAKLPADVQDEYAAQLEMDLHERERIAAQLADPRETDLDFLLEQARCEIAAGEVYDLDELL